MIKKLIKKIWIITVFTILTINIPFIVSAADKDIDVDWFNILPELSSWDIWKVNEAIKEIWESWWGVRDKYNKKAKEWDKDPSKQIASWIMTRDTIMNYLVFVVRFLSQLWLLVWTWFIIYAWYEYMISVFNWWKTPRAKLGNAIIWIIIIIFSYAIMRTLTSLIGIS